jgi:hypothetical protein
LKLSAASCGEWLTDGFRVNLQSAAPVCGTLHAP